MNNNPEIFSRLKVEMQRNVNAETNQK